MNRPPFTSVEALAQLAWHQLVQVSLLAVIVFLAVRLLAKHRPHLAHALWALVLLKCIVPPVISSPIAPVGWLSSLTSETSSVQPSNITPAIPQDSARLSTQMVIVSKAQARESPEHPLTPSKSGPVSSELAGSDEHVQRHSVGPTWIWAILSLWLAGSSVSAVLLAVRLHRFLRDARGSAIVAPEWVSSQLRDLKRKLGIRQNVHVLVVDSRIGPAVTGLWRPAILLPKILIERSSPQKLEPLIGHELVHIRRGDLWWAAVQSCVICMWWFHPLVRWITQAFAQETERSCDEETIGGLGCEPAEYARALLSVLEHKQHLRIAPALPGVKPVDLTSQRMEKIMSLQINCNGRRPKWITAGLLVGCLLVVPSTLPTSKELLAQEDETKATPESQEQADSRVYPNPVPMKPMPLPRARVRQERERGLYQLQSFEVSELVAKIERQLSVSRQDAEGYLLSCLPRAFWLDGDSTTPLGMHCEFVLPELGVCKLGHNEPPMKILDDRLYVFAPNQDMHQIEEHLRELETHGVISLRLDCQLWDVPVNQVAKLLDGMSSHSDLASLAALQGRISLPSGDLQAAAQAQPLPTPQTLNQLANLSLDEGEKLEKRLQEISAADRLSAPAVMVLDGQTASVWIGSEHAFPADQNTDHSVTIPAGISMELTPKLSDDVSELDLRLRFRRSEIDPSETTSVRIWEPTSASSGAERADPDATNDNSASDVSNTATVLVAVPSVRTSTIDSQVHGVAPSSCMVLTVAHPTHPQRCSLLIVRSGIYHPPVPEATQAAIATPGATITVSGQLSSEVQKTLASRLRAAGINGFKVVDERLQIDASEPFEQVSEIVQSVVQSVNQTRRQTLLIRGNEDLDLVGKQRLKLLPGLFADRQIDATLDGQVTFREEQGQLIVEANQLEIADGEDAEFKLYGEHGQISIRPSGAVHAAKFSQRVQFQLGSFRANCQTLELTDNRLTLAGNVHAEFNDMMMETDRIETELGFDQLLLRGEVRMRRNGGDGEPVDLHATEVSWTPETNELKSAKVVGVEVSQR